MLGPLSAKVLSRRPGSLSGASWLLLVLRLLVRQTTISPATIAARTNPPIVPPTIVPMLDFLLGLLLPVALAATAVAVVAGEAVGGTLLVVTTVAVVDEVAAVLVVGTELVLLGVLSAVESGPPSKKVKELLQTLKSDSPSFAAASSGSNWSSEVTIKTSSIYLVQLRF